MEKYDVKSVKSENFMHPAEIKAVLDYAAAHCHDTELVKEILAKAGEMNGLTAREATLLLLNNSQATTQAILQLAQKIKQAYYGDRVVLFAPLYLSNYCVNSCAYCPYHFGNKHIPRKKMTQEEIRAEVIALQDMGHKRLALEAGEDPVHNPLEYILESIDTIYGIHHKAGAIRRVNVNIAAATVEEYRRLHEAKIGTYILFQETYNKVRYEKLHVKGPKANYAYHTEAMDRAMQAGIEDVGLGTLFGLNDYAEEFIGLLLHAEHLETVYGAGPHTISVPRLRPADGINPTAFNNALPDDIFIKIIALLRLAVPYTGLIISTRESEEIRQAALSVGISQISGGSKTSVGGYTQSFSEETAQFEIADNRTLEEVVQWLLKLGYVPSFCTACYAGGRVGHHFMEICKNKQIQQFCSLNAMLTLNEYLSNYAQSEQTRLYGKAIIDELIRDVPKTLNDKLKERLLQAQRGNVKFF